MKSMNSPNALLMWQLLGVDNAIDFCGPIGLLDGYDAGDSMDGGCSGENDDGNGQNTAEVKKNNCVKFCRALRL